MFVTPLYASLLVLWFVVLSMRVVNIRRRSPGASGARFGYLKSRTQTLKEKVTRREARPGSHRSGQEETGNDQGRSRATG